MNATLDHVVFACEDVDDATETFARHGLAPDYGGVHEQDATEMALLGFEDGSYLELLAPADPDESPEQWPDEMFTAGPCRWCLEVDDVGAELDRLNEAGAEVSGPHQYSRRRPDGTVTEYEAGVYGTEGTFWQFPFLIEDLTPRHYRVQPSESVADSSLTGVSQVVVAVENLDQAIGQFRRLHSYPEPRRTDHESFGGALASFPSHPVILAEPLDDEMGIADRLDRYPSCPCAYLVGTDDFTAAAAEYELTGSSEWFGSRVGWFDSPELDRRVGVIGE